MKSVHAHTPTYFLSPIPKFARDQSLVFYLWGHLNPLVQSASKECQISMSV